MVRGVAQRGWDSGDWGTDAMPLAGSSTGRAIAERRPVHIPDLADKPDLPEDKKVAVRKAGGLSVLYAPMLSERHGVGSIVAARETAKAVLRARDRAPTDVRRPGRDRASRTRGCSTRRKEALERQTATAEVLDAISSSSRTRRRCSRPFSTQCERLFGARTIGIYTIGDDEMVRGGGLARPEGRGSPARRHPACRKRDRPGHPRTPHATTSPDHGRDHQSVADAARSGEPPSEAPRSSTRRCCGRTSGLGSIAVVRWPPRPFSEREQALLQTFADQAVDRDPERAAVRRGASRARAIFPRRCNSRPRRPTS